MGNPYTCPPVFAHDVIVLVSANSVGWCNLWLSDGVITASGQVARHTNARAVQPQTDPGKTQAKMLAQGYLTVGILPLAYCKRSLLTAKGIAQQLGERIHGILFHERLNPLYTPVEIIALRAACYILRPMISRATATLSGYAEQSWAGAPDAAWQDEVAAALKLSGEPALGALASRLLMERAVVAASSVATAASTHDRPRVRL